jgi:hypothetical protein
MRRIGPWVFAAGLVVLCAGIVSTRSASWKKPQRGTQTIALDFNGVDTLDVGTHPYNLLRISDLPPAMHFEWYGLADEQEGTEPITVIRDGSRMRLERRSRKTLYARVTLNLPPALGTLSGRQLNIRAPTAVGALRIEAFDINWKGNARSLDIRTRYWPVESQGSCTSLPKVSFAEGRVERLRISIERGDVYLGDLSQVGQIEVHASPTVGLKVGHIEDLRRIQLLPFDGETTPAPTTPDVPCMDHLPVPI